MAKPFEDRLIDAVVLGVQDFGRLMVARARARGHRQARAQLNRDGVTVNLTGMVRRVTVGTRTSTLRRRRPAQRRGRVLKRVSVGVLDDNLSGLGSLVARRIKKEFG